MPRNGSGTFTLVSGNPVVTGTTIEANWANTTLSDIATTLTDSLSRSGQGGMTAALRVADGTQGAPGVGFANETGSGFYRAGTGEVWAVVQGAQTLNLDASGVYVPADKTTTVDGAFVFNEAGADKDARFEGDTDANLLFTDASTDRVGVGTNAPSTKMTVRGATQSQEVALRWERATDGAVAGGLGYFYDSENSVAVGSVTNHPLKLIVNDTTGATLTTTGLGIGTSSPGHKLDVNGTGRVTTEVRVKNTAGNVSYLTFEENGNGNSATFISGDARTTGNMGFWTNSTERMRLDSSGNLGLGVTPSAWGSNFRSLDVLSFGASVASSSAGNTLTSVAHNAYNDNTNWRYRASSIGAARYEMTGANAGSTHAWYVSAGGTAGNAISFTQAMTLSAGGDLFLGATGAAFAERFRMNGAYAVFDDASYTGFIGRGTALGTATASDFAIRSSNALAFLAGGATERARITSGGAFLVGGQTALTSGAPAGTAADFRGGLALSAASAVNGAYQELSFPAGIYTKCSIRGYSTGTTDAGELRFFTAPASDVNQERARITSGGDLLVGVTSGTRHWLSKSNAADYAVTLNNSNANPIGAQIYHNTDVNGAGNQFLDCQGAGNVRAQIRSNGGLANYSGNDVNLSDRREKTNFAPAKSYLDTICAIPVQTFEYIDQSPDDPGLTLGVVAQDVQAVAPELVMESNWGTADEPKMRLSIYQTDLQYALMKCIQEQQALITDLRARVAALEAQP